MNLNELLLSEDEDSQAIEAEEGAFFEPFPDKDSGVVITEPEIITIGRGRRKRALRKLQQQPGDV